MIKLHCRNSLSFLTFLAISLASFAQQTYVPDVVDPLSESWRWRHFPELEGKGVRSIAEAEDRIVWFGIDNGVLEYDGYQWKLHNEQQGLDPLAIEMVYAARDGRIYAVSSRSIFRFNGQNWLTLFRHPENLDLNFDQIRELSDGSIMVCSQIGVIHLRKDKITDWYITSRQASAFSGRLDINLIQLPEQLTEGQNVIDFSDVLEDDQGYIWLAVSVRNAGKLIKFKLSPASAPYLTEYEIHASSNDRKFGEDQKMILSKNGVIWIINSSAKTGIHTFDGERWEYLMLGHKFGGDEYATDIVQASDGRIWIGSLGKLYAFDHGGWTLYKAPEVQIPANKLILHPSKADNIWIAGLKSRVLLVDYSFEHWKTYRGLNFQFEVTPSESWFINEQGRAIFKNVNEWISYGVEDGLMDALIRLIYTSKGQIWAAGSHRGVAATAQFKNGRWIRTLHPHLSWGIDYRAVFEASDGSLWFGGAVDPEPERGQLGGVLQLLEPHANPLQWIHHKPQENGLLQSNAYGIGQSGNGIIWLGGSSLHFFDGRQWNQAEMENLRQYINTIESLDGELWVGSRYYGIFHFNGKQWINHDTRQGLPSNTIISIDAIKNDDIWVATENGICHYDGQKWLTNIFPAKMNLQLEGGSIQHAADGTIWINKASRNWKRRAYNYGAVPDYNSGEFVTFRYVADDFPPETKITFFTEVVAPDGNTLIRWQGNDYFRQSPGQKVSFSWRLNEGGWSDFTEVEHYTFLSLAPGEYQLEVRARDADFNVDPTPAKIHFRVQPPVWRQSWFILLLFTFLLALGILEYRVRSKKKKLEKMNVSLTQANVNLQYNTQRIEAQNQEILEQRNQILIQKAALEKSYQQLAKKNKKIVLQRNKLETMVQQVEKLSATKLKFFTNISHELRTPLTLILGPLEQLQEGNLPAGEKDQLYQIINRNTARLLKLINQLLDMRSIESNALKLQLQSVPLTGFVGEIVTLFTSMSRRKNIDLSFNSDCPRPLYAIDADKVEKIIVNLLSNAFKHTPEGGVIKVRLKEVAASRIDLPVQCDKYLVLKVIDTGQGMEKEELSQLFKRYYRSGSITEQSSGIGLSYIKELIEIHQGEIRVHSEKNKGTKFELFLPVLPLPASVEEVHFHSDMLTAQLELRSWWSAIPQSSFLTPEAAVGNGDRKRLLLVEDNPDMLVYLESVLKDHYLIVKAANGSEALQLARNHNFDLIISDIMMPEMDGLEFSRQLKQNFATSHIPVILLTARTMEKDRVKGFLSGADDYLIKPFDPQLLQVRIKNLLVQRQQLRIKFNREFALQPKQVQLTSPDETLLKRIVEMMEEGIDDPNFNVNKMCSMVHLSHMHFIRKVKQLTGKKPVTLLKSFRMKRAKELLAQNKLSISEVAYKVGFDLPNSFSRAFKKEFGLTPTEFIERSRV